SPLLADQAWATLLNIQLQGAAEEGVRVSNDKRQQMHASICEGQLSFAIAFEAAGCQNIVALFNLITEEVGRAITETVNAIKCVEQLIADFFDATNRARIPQIIEETGDHLFYALEAVDRFGNRTTDLLSYQVKEGDNVLAA